MTPLKPCSALSEALSCTQPPNSSAPINNVERQQHFKPRSSWPVLRVTFAKRQPGGHL